MRFPTKSSCIHVAQGDAMKQERGGGVGSFQLELNNIFIKPQRQLVHQMQSVCKRRIMEFPNRGSAKNSFIDSVSWDTPRALGRPRTNLWVGWGPAPAIS